MSALTRCERAIVTGRSCGSVEPVAATSRASDVLEERAARALHRAAADLLVVVGDEQLRVRAPGAAREQRGAWRCGRSRGCPGAAPRPTSRRCRWPRTAGASASTRSWPSDVAGVDAGDGGEVVEQRPVAVGARPPHRDELRLRVELQPLAHAAVEVDRERRQAHRSAGQHDQAQVADAAVAPRTASRPATVSSRSSQVWASSPPYGSTPTSR